MTNKQTWSTAAASGDASSHVPQDFQIDTVAPELSDRFASALQLAYELHRFHLRKGSRIPYLSHALAVSALVLEYGGTEDQAIAALLHDAIEDAGGEPVARRIEHGFGAPVVELVRACTEIQADPRPPWRERKEQYLAHLAEAPEGSILITLADKTHNAESTLDRIRVEGADSVWAHFNAGPDQQRWWYTELVAAYERRGAPHPLLQRFARAVDGLVGSMHAATEGSRT